MRKKLLLFFFVWSGVLNFWGQTCDFQSFLNDIVPYDYKNKRDAKLLPSKLKIEDENIAPLLKQNNYLGFIGKNKKRLKIFFHSIKKTENPKRYAVKGNTIVDKNNLGFQGFISVEKVYSFSVFSFGIDDEFKGKVKDQGVLTLDYEFNEDEKLPALGVFKGKGIVFWYVNDKGKFLYDDMEFYTDGYFNNSFLGTWTSYKTGKTQECNFGQYRIPCSGDLDIGVGEFYPSPKYYPYGWKNYLEK